ncbi:MAG: phytanoyl-CoA dioxygenase family protein [Armatimonadaceae bacterium]
MEERDLSFAPVENSNPQKLLAEQIAFYNEHGYVSPLSVFDTDEAIANRAYFDMLLEQLNTHRDGRDTYAINGYQATCRGIWDLCCHPKILDYVEDLTGPNIIAWATHYFCKLPHDPKHVPWHQDASYWPLSPARTVTVWLAIDDADAENSAMLFLPGTHRAGHLEWKETEKAAVLNQEIADVERFGTPVVNTLKAGQISLHADMLAHGSYPNTSDRRRCGLTIRYCPPEVKPLKPEWGRQAILCRGTDTTGHWQHNPRPERDDITYRPIYIGGN